MKIMIIISLLLSSLFAQNFERKEFAAKAMELGYEYGKCTFGSSKEHYNGKYAAKKLSISRAIDKLAISKCGKKYNNTVSASATISYKVLLTGKVEGQYVSAICFKKPIICH